MIPFAQTLRYKVSVQRRAVGKDAVGQPVETWPEFAAPWADIRHLAGLEAIRADAMTGKTRASMRMHYRTDFTIADRVVFAGVIYEIKAILPDLVNRRHIDLVCEVFT